MVQQPLEQETVGFHNMVNSHTTRVYFFFYGGELPEKMIMLPLVFFIMRVAAVSLYPFFGAEVLNNIVIEKRQ